MPAAGTPRIPAAVPEARSVPSLMAKAPVKVLAPESTKMPLPDLVTRPVPFTKADEMVRAFAGVVPAVVMTSSLLVADVVIPEPLMVRPPPALSCKIPPKAVALVEVIERFPPRVRLPPVRRTVFAAETPVTETSAATR